MSESDWPTLGWVSHKFINDLGGDSGASNSARTPGADDRTGLRWNQWRFFRTQWKNHTIRVGRFRSSGFDGGCDDFPGAALQFFMADTLLPGAESVSIHRRCIVVG